MKKYFILTVIQFLTTHPYAQDRLNLSTQKNKIDSLQQILKTAKEDTNKVIILNKLGVKYIWNDPPKAIDYSLLIPLHHKLERWITKIMVQKNKKIRLEAAKKTIQQLQG